MSNEFDEFLGESARTAFKLVTCPIWIPLVGIWSLYKLFEMALDDMCGFKKD